MIVKLTARTVESIKPTPGRRAEYFDATVQGLALRVTERGHKSWTVMYRHRGRLRRMTLGDASAIPLAEARDRAREAIRDASKGTDAATAKREARDADTIGELATSYIEKYAKRKKRSWRTDDQILRAEILPNWRHRAVKDIRRRDARALVDAIADRGAPIMANRTAALLSKLFRFALDEELIDASPAVKIPRPGQERSRDRVLSEDELRALWEAWKTLEGPMAAFYKLRLLTAQRGAEVAAARWQDVDLVKGWWTVPATVAKNKLAHRVPLSPAVVTLLESLKASAPPSGIRESRAVYVLAGARGKRQQTEAAATFPVADFRGHDLRRTAASLMAGGGIPRLTISKILNHVETGVTAVYDRHSYDREKRAALDWWALKLTGIVEGKQTGTVVPFTKGA